jgi:DNA-binding MarR family transcriptional regulator
MTGTRRQLDFVDDYLSYLLARASHLVSKQFHEQVKQHGLAVTEWRVLATLSDGDGLTVSELADIVLFKQPTLTRIIDRMVRDGLLLRRIDAEDRRRTLIFVTPRGRAAISDLLGRAKAHEREVLAEYGAAEVSRLKEMLRTLIDRLASAKPRRPRAVGTVAAERRRRRSGTDS